MNEIVEIEITPGDVQPGNSRKPKATEPQPFERKLLERFRKRVAGTLLAKAEVRFREMAMLWDYLHHQLWRFDGPPRTSIRFKNQKQALDYYRVAESTALRYVQIARQFMEQLHPKGIPEHAPFNAEMAKLAFEMWKKDNSLNSVNPDKLLLIAHDDGVLEQATTLAPKHGREYRKLEKRRADKQALLKGQTRQQKAIRGAQADAEQFIEQKIPTIIDSATSLYSMLSNDKIKISAKQRGEIEFAAKYVMYCVLFTAESLPVNYLTYKDAVDIASRKGFDALEQESKPAHYALKYSFADILKQFNEVSGKQIEQRHVDD